MVATEHKQKLTSCKVTKDLIKDIKIVLKKEEERIKGGLKELAKNRLEEVKKEYGIKSDETAKNIAESEYKRYIPRYRITLGSKDETLEFDNIDDLLGLDFFPKKINSLTIRFWNNAKHKLEEYIEIHIPLSESGSSSYFSIAHGDEDILQNIQRDLSRIFEKHKTSYYWVYYAGGGILAIFSILFTFLFVWLIEKITVYLGLPITNYFKLGSPLWIILVTGLSLISLSISSYLWPFIEFALGESLNFRTKLKKFIYVIISGVVVGVIGSIVYDILKTH